MVDIQIVGNIDDAGNFYLSAMAITNTGELLRVGANNNLTGIDLTLPQGNSNMNSWTNAYVPNKVK